MKKAYVFRAIALLPWFIGYSVPAASKSDSPQDKIEVIEVSAQKHKQAIEDIAISVSVIEGQIIDELNLKDTTALSAQAPNFKISQNAAEGTPPAVNIRGVGSMDYNTSTTSPVGIYLDNVATGSANAQLINLFDIDTIEILRGPQGTLFGRNTTGGAVLINSKRPQNTFASDFTLSFAQQNHQSAEGMLNIPITENSATRFAFSHHEYEYSTNNLYAPAPIADMRQSMGRLSYAGDYDGLEVFAKIHGEYWDGIVQPVGNIGVVKSLDPVTGQPAELCTAAESGSLACTDILGFNDGSEDFYDISVNNNINGNSPHTTESWGADIQLKYPINHRLHLEGLFSYNTLDRIHYFNSDGSPARTGEGGQNVYLDVRTFELRLHAEQHNSYFIGGVYFLDENIIQDNHFDLFRDFRNIPGLHTLAARFKYDNTIDTRAYAVFGHYEYSLTEQTSVTAGLRYTDEDTDYRAIGLINVALEVGDHNGLTVPGWDTSGIVSDGKLSGKLAINHHFDEQFSGFMSYARGFKSGGYNGALISSADAAERNDYGAETLDAYEFGLRFKNQDNSVRLNTAAFYYDYQNQQVFMNTQATEPGAPPLQLLDNVGESTIYGLEAELFWQPDAAVTFQLSAGYLPKAQLKQFVDAAGNEINNNRLPFTSKTNVSGMAQYVSALGNGNLVMQLTFDYQSKFYFDQNQNEYASQKGYTLLGARLAWELEHWSLALWGKNLTGEQYSHLKFDMMNFLGMLQDFKGEKRQIGVDIGYAF